MFILVTVGVNSAVEILILFYDTRKFAHIEEAAKPYSHLLPVGSFVALQTQYVR
jgi:hypothetical protein